MNGVQIQYLLGIYFLVSSISFASGRLSADAVRFIAGVGLLVLALVRVTLI